MYVKGVSPSATYTKARSMRRPSGKTKLRWLRRYASRMRRRIVTRSTACRRRRLGTEIRNATVASERRRWFGRATARRGNARREKSAPAAPKSISMSLQEQSFSFLYSPSFFIRDGGSAGLVLAQEEVDGGRHRRSLGRGSCDVETQAGISDRFCRGGAKGGDGDVALLEVGEVLQK